MVFLGLGPEPLLGEPRLTGSFLPVTACAALLDGKDDRLQEQREGAANGHKGLEAKRACSGIGYDDPEQAR
jgi:hypothetical protein